MNIDEKEARLEKEYLEIGMKAKVSEVLEGVDLHIPSLTKFINKKFVEWPRRLQDCASFAGEADAALYLAESKFYNKLPEQERAEALLRVVIWQAWENKYQDGNFNDLECGIVITGLQRHKALEEKALHAVGHIINHLAKGDLKLDEITTEKLWKTFAAFVGELKDPWLLEPLRRKGLLLDEQKQQEVAA